MGSGPAMLFDNPVQVQNGVFVNLNMATPRYSLVEKFWHNGKGYRAVKFDNGAGNVAPSAGGPAYWMDSSAGKVTSDKTSSEAGAAIPTGVAGIFLTATITDLNYTIIQTDGTHLAVRLLAADSNGAVGNKIFAPVADADADLRSEADGSIAAAEIPATEVGRQMAAGSGNLAEVFLSIP